MNPCGNGPEYGPDWPEKNRDVIQQRLRSWGINTIGNWSDSHLAAMKKTPYTDSIASGGARMIEGSEGYCGKFPDVFDPSFTNALRRSADCRAAAGSRGGRDSRVANPT